MFTDTDNSLLVPNFLIQIQNIKLQVLMKVEEWQHPSTTLVLQ